MRLPQLTFKKIVLILSVSIKMTVLVALELNMEIENATQLTAASRVTSTV